MLGFSTEDVREIFQYYQQAGQIPADRDIKAIIQEMLDPNTKTDYNKMKKLLQLDKLDGDRKGVILTVAEKGEIACRLEETFPAHKITDPEIFPSLLFYYGMLTIKGTKGAKLVMGIPNNNVRKIIVQLKEWILGRMDEV